jgi:hypothetical protein
MLFEPVFEVPDGKDILGLQCANSPGHLYTYVDGGEVYVIRGVPGNPRGYGEKSVYSLLMDGDGTVSDVSFVDLVYALQNAIVYVEYYDYEVVKEQEFAHSANLFDKVRGSYVSPVLKIDEDFGFWKYITWRQVSGSLSRVVVAIRVANSQDELEQEEWFYVSESSVGYYGNLVPSSTVNFDLDRFNLKGACFQFKVELETGSDQDAPVVSDLSVVYVGKHRVYFFTEMIKLNLSNAMESMLMTAKVTKPKFTDVVFGVSEANTTNFSDYKTIDIDELETLPESFKKRLKLGIKFASQSLVNFPIVHEFAFEVESDKDSLLNEG